MLQPRVVSVKPLKDYKLLLQFETGEKNFLMSNHIFPENGMVN